jgi:hypothetical protein
MVAEKTRLPVRSALFKHDTGGLVVKWVTISESLLLYVFDFFFLMDKCFCLSALLFLLTCLLNLNVRANRQAEDLRDHCNWKKQEVVNVS